MRVHPTVPIALCVLLLAAAGCRERVSGESPDDRAGTAGGRPAPIATDESSPEEDAVSRTLQDFLAAFQARDGSGCLAALTPELRERYAHAFRSGAAFEVTGKSNQAILMGSDRVAVDVIEGDRARGRYFTTPPPGEGRYQVGLLHVTLSRREGAWLICEIDLGLDTPSPAQQRQQTAH